MSSPLSPDQPVEAPAAGSSLREAALTAAAAGVVVLFAASLLLLDRKYFWIDDAQSGALPTYSEINRAWRSGELPLLSRSSWRGGALAAELSVGDFSPSLTLSILLAFGLNLSLPLTAAVLALLHLGVLGAGVFRLARRQGLSVELAFLATLVGSINGWIILWGARNWGLCLYSFAWLPWFWWALERARAGRGGWLAFAPAGLFLFLIITAGWPFTILMAAIVTLWVMARTWADRRSLLALWPAPAAWVVGIGLSAPAWLMALEFGPYSARVRNVPWLEFSSSWVVPFDALPGLILPNVVAVWPVYGEPRPHVSAELAGGLAPVVILIACLWRRGRGVFRALPWEWALCGLGLLLSMWPMPAKLWHSFRWLPLFFLALGLLAAHALAWARSSEARADAVAPSTSRKLPNLGRIALYLLLAFWLREFLSPPWFDTRLIASGAVLALAACLWSFIEEGYAPTVLVRAWAPCAVVILSCWVAYAGCLTVGYVPQWDIGEQARQAGPLDPNVRYLSVHTWPDMITDYSRYDVNNKRVLGVGEQLYIGTTSSYAGLDFVNGYSPMGPLGLQDVFKWRFNGCFDDEAAAERVISCEAGPDGLLRRMGVDGLVVSERFDSYRPTLLSYGWKETAQVKGGRVYQRSGPPSPRAYAVTEAEVVPAHDAARDALVNRGTAPAPSVLLPSPGEAVGKQTFAPAQVSVVEDGRNSMTVDVTSAPGEGDALVVFTRPWFPGYRAYCDGKPMPVEVYDLFLPAVRMPAGTNGRVVLEYWPTSLTIGFWLAGTTAAALALAVAATAARRLVRRRAAPETVARPAVAATAPVPEQLLA